MEQYAVTSRCLSSQITPPGTSSFYPVTTEAAEEVAALRTRKGRSNRGDRA